MMCGDSPLTSYELVPNLSLARRTTLAAAAFAAQDRKSTRCAESYPFDTPYGVGQAGLIVGSLTCVPKA